MAPARLSIVRRLATTRTRLALAFAVSVAALAPAVVPMPVAACSGARVEYAEIRNEATRIVVGTIIDRRGDPAAPDAIAVRVERLIRGVSPIDLVLEPPDYMGCDGRIAEPIGTRLVIATGRRFFDAAPPNDLHPYWIVGPGDILDPAGVESADPAIRTVSDLAAAVGGEMVPVTVPSGPPVEALPGAAITGDDARGLDWSMPAALAATALIVAGWFAARVLRRRGADG